MASLTENTTTNSGVLPVIPSAHWLIRLSIAGTFLYHGMTKFPGLAAQAEWMGMPVALWAAVAVIEVLAGIGILAGGALASRAGDILTRLSGVGVVVIMIGAIGLVHWGQWSNVPSESHPFGGMEFQTLLLALGLFFGLRGNAA